MQQINLYTQDLRPKKTVLPLSQIVAITAVLLVILVASTVYYRGQVTALEAKIVPGQQQVDQLQQQVANIEVKLQATQQDASLVEHNALLNKRVIARKQLISMLDSVVMANRYPFSNLLTGLAQHRVDRLWLTRIQFSEGGRSVGLRGKTLQAEAVPHYLQMLRGESLFLGRTFNLFQLTSDEENDAILHFTLSSTLMNMRGTNE